VFAQTYGLVEGDSASVAELCALLSALAATPIRQSVAVTGSVHQHGQVQAIGGVNEKIEGLFDVCLARGLTGTQGLSYPLPACCISCYAGRWWRRGRAVSVMRPWQYEPTRRPRCWRGLSRSTCCWWASARG
jgi:hypothetical protein